MQTAALKFFQWFTDGFKVDWAFHPNEVDKMSTKNFWELSGKK